MNGANELCSLDYLIGTLSTAYKGVITSLAARDFCISEEAGETMLNGTVLAMPPGNYEASLIQKGVELARTTLEQGAFRLRAPSGQVKQATDLQIDIIQSGRHIGTFLLRKKDASGVFRSAADLSAEIRDLDFKLLTVPLRNKPGLLAKAEEIITDILSTKKDWPAFSERLNTFRQDFFWSARDAWYEAFPILARFLRKAAESAGPDENKPLLNFLSLMEDLLSQEPDRERLLHAATVWLAELNASALEPVSRFRRFLTVLEAVHDLFPTADIAPALGRILGSIRQVLRAAPAEFQALLDALRNHPPAGVDLAQYGAEARDRLLRSLDRADDDLRRGAFKEVFSTLAGLDPTKFESRWVIGVFQSAAHEQLNRASAADFTAGILELIRLVPQLSLSALGTMRSLVPDMVRRLAEMGRTDLCGKMIDGLSGTGVPQTEDLLMEPALARSVAGSGNRSLMRAYEAALTRIVIPAPQVRELSAENWAEVVNPLHLDRIVKFIDIIRTGDDLTHGLLVHAIANLSLSGVFIPDDRIFQRRISAYLNSSAMNAPFLLNFLLLAKLPVYYHEVGAVSRIRDLSTAIDSWGNDPVLYFLRKQVHVNASNYNVRLLERVIAAWAGNDLSLVREVVPADIYASRKTELVERYSAVMAPFFLSQGVLDDAGLHLERLLDLPDEVFRPGAREGQLDEVPSKVMLLCMLYREVVKKYSFDRGQEGTEPGSLAELVDRLREEREVILRAEKTEAREDLYFKRHIAFGIPSVLGTYHEPKFDALDRFLRTGAVVRKQLEESVMALASLGPHAPLEEIRSRLRVLALCRQVFALHGLENPQLEEFEAVIEQGPVRISQVVDVLRMWQKEIGWMVRHITMTFHRPLVSLLDRWPSGELPAHLRALDRKDPDFTSKAADIVIRDLMAAVPGLMETDRIIAQLLDRLSIRAGLDDGQINGFFEKAVPWYFDVAGLSDDEVRRQSPLVGGKAKNLAYLHNRGFPIPAAAVLSARFTQPGIRERELAPAIREAVRLIEKRTGAGFGDPGNPLFLAVRSGSYVSMPGILSTVLYCGMNEDTLRALVRITGDARLAYDAKRRFIEQYSQTVLALDPAVLEKIRNELLKEAGQEEMEQLRPRDLERLAGRYERELQSRGLAIPQDVWVQAQRTVECIYASWLAERAEQFRRATGTSSQWGTSAMLMQMVFANASGSGSSVFFTRNPFTLEPGVYGETRAGATGDELVYGRRLSVPISRVQTERRQGGLRSLEESDPELYRLHQDLALSIEAALGGLPQEVEAAYVREREGTPRLFVLQTRRMELQPRRPGRFDEICGMESRIVGRGVGAYGGAVSGVAGFTHRREEAERLSKKSGMPVILIRTTANTDDVSLMPVIGGILTASGGVTSHAAVLAQKFGVNAVVACSRLLIGSDAQGRVSARIGEFEVREGDLISLDGATGLVFSGSCLTTSGQVR